MKSVGFVHFGPVWGRPVGHSMAALCMGGKEPDREPRTLTRSATVTCPDCIDLIPRLTQVDAAIDAAMSAKGG